jgi:hypothetical protein
VVYAISCIANSIAVRMKRRSLLKIESGERPAYTWDRTFREGRYVRRFGGRAVLGDGSECIFDVDEGH